MTDGPNAAEFRTMMTQVREGETDRPDDFVFSDPAQRKKKEKPKAKWNANNKYASSRVDDWMGAPGAKAKKGYKVKAVSTAPLPEDPAEEAASARPSIASESPLSRRWKPSPKDDNALPPWMSVDTPSKQSSPKKWTPKKHSPPPPPVNRPAPAEEPKVEKEDVVAMADKKAEETEELPTAPEEAVEQPEDTVLKEEAKLVEESQAPSKETEEVAETLQTSEDSEHEVASESEFCEVDSDDDTHGEEKNIEVAVPLKLQDFSIEEIAMGLSVNEGGSKNEWPSKLKTSMEWAMNSRD